MNIVKIKIIDDLKEQIFTHSCVKTQGGQIHEIDLDRLSPPARAIAEACAVTGVTRFHDRAAIWGRTKESGNRINILLPLWRGREFMHVTDPHDYFERCAKWHNMDNVDITTIQAPKEVCPGIFQGI